MESVKRGGGREDTHHAIRAHSLSINPDSQSGLLPRQELARRLGQDLRIPLDETEISEMLERPQNWLGNAPEQAQYFVEQVLAWIRRFPDSNSLCKGLILSLTFY